MVYMVVEAADRRALEKEVNRLLGLGWVPAGGVEWAEEAWLQALTMTGENDDGL